jgi:uncharacterized protein YqjF (DUF2071 family)
VTAARARRKLAARRSPAPSPQRRDTPPAGGVPLLHQSWRHLVFVHWALAPEQLARRLPAALPLDTWQGQAYLGLVAFVVENNRLTLMPPVPFLARFYEVNLRTYVRPPGREPGVYFFSLDASHAVIAAAARTFYGLPYHASRARLVKIRAPGKPPRFSMSFRREGPMESEAAFCRLGYSVSGDGPRSAAPGTLTHFLVERYVLYTASGEEVEATRVAHEPYPVQGAQLHRLEETLSTAAGTPRLGNPSHAHYARGVDVKIFAKRSSA